MALKLDNTLLDELGLTALPEPEKQSLLRHIYETLEMRVGMRLADQMSNEQLDEFEKFVNANDDSGAFKWLESNFPNYKDVVNDEFEKLKAEVGQVAPQILSQSQQAIAQGGQPGQPTLPGQPQPQPAPNGLQPPDQFAQQNAPQQPQPQSQFVQNPGQPNQQGQPGAPAQQPYQPAPQPLQPFPTSPQQQQPQPMQQPAQPQYQSPSPAGSQQFVNPNGSSPQPLQPYQPAPQQQPTPPPPNYPHQQPPAGPGQQPPQYPPQPA